LRTQRNSRGSKTEQLSPNDPFGYGPACQYFGRIQQASLKLTTHISF